MICKKSEVDINHKRCRWWVCYWFEIVYYIVLTQGLFRMCYLESVVKKIIHVDTVDFNEHKMVKQERNSSISTI